MASSLRLALALVGGSLAPAADAEPYDPPIPTREQRQVLHKLVPPPQQADSSVLALQDQFDVTHYLLDLEFVPQGATGTVSGSVTISARSLVEDLERVVLDLRSNMAVSAVTRGLTSLQFTHADDVLDITLDHAYDTDLSFAVKVTYAGEPIPSGFGSIRWNKYIGAGQGQMVSTLSEPQGARDWWPCKDRPDDKAMVEEWWTVPANWTATGNGVLLGSIGINGDQRRFRWRPSRPLTTYLVSIAATDYVSFEQAYTPLSGGRMPIVHYVYAEDLADAEASFSATPDMLQFFAATFGEYPFIEDKYGMSAFPWGGAMEHTTNTSYGYKLINGGHNYDFVIAHEIAHQWWGDSLSPREWKDVWLNEGFAVHSEALWFEHLNGPRGYQDYMNAQWQESFTGPVYDNAQAFGTTVYDKGAWVQHMLRGVLGDAPFFQALRDWYASHKDGVVDTAGYQAHMAAAHGASLEWFFAQWVYGVGAPRYEYGWTTADLGDGTWRSYVRIRQVQDDAGIFAMPVQLTLSGPGSTEVRSVWNDTADQDFVLDTPWPVADLGFDTRDWILKAAATPIVLDDADLDGVPDRNDNCPGLGNPAQQDWDGDALGDACDDDDDADGLADAEDCAPLDPQAGLPDEVARLDLGKADGSVAALQWTSAPRADAYDVSRATLSALVGQADYGICLAPLVRDLTLADTDEPAGAEGFGYLVRGHDAVCGGGPLGSDSLGNPRPSPCP